jgi:Fur family iron response transcriptional regulator
MTATRPAATTAELSALIEQHGLRPTAQRLRIAELLLAAPVHLSADQMLASLRRTNSRVSKATLYNTLHLFAEHGLARPIHLEPGRCVYDSTMHPHHHFQDLDTSEVSDIDAAELEFARLPALPPGTELVGVEVVIRVRRKRAADRDDGAA